MDPKDQRRGKAHLAEVKAVLDGATPRVETARRTGPTRPRNEPEGRTADDAGSRRVDPDRNELALRVAALEDEVQRLRAALAAVVEHASDALGDPSG